LLILTTGEVIIYDRAMNATEIGSISSSLQAKWGMPSQKCDSRSDSEVMVRGEISVAQLFERAGTGAGSTAISEDTVGASASKNASASASDGSGPLYFTAALNDADGVAAMHSPSTAFINAVARGQTIGSKVVAITPEPHFDVGVAVSAAAVDGLYRNAPPVFLHVNRFPAIRSCYWCA
jgi:hypothetical protein